MDNIIYRGVKYTNNETGTVVKSSDTVQAGETFGGFVVTGDKQGEFLEGLLADDFTLYGATELKEITCKTLIDYINRQATLNPNIGVNIECSTNWLTANLVREFLGDNDKGEFIIKSTWHNVKVKSPHNDYDYFYIPIVAGYSQLVKNALRDLYKKTITEILSPEQYLITHKELQTHLIPLLTNAN